MAAEGAAVTETVEKPTPVGARTCSRSVGVANKRAACSVVNRRKKIYMSSARHGATIDGCEDSFSSSEAGDADTQTGSESDLAKPVRPSVTGVEGNSVQDNGQSSVGSDVEIVRVYFRPRTV